MSDDIKPVAWMCGITVHHPEVELRLACPSEIEAAGMDGVTPLYPAAAIEALRAERDWYKRRVDALQSAQTQMRDPERTMVCDIIANGSLLSPAGDRYTMPIAERDAALARLREALRELVRLKAMKDQAWMSHDEKIEYQERKPAAWEAARAALAATEA